MICCNCVVTGSSDAHAGRAANAAGNQEHTDTHCLMAHVNSPQLRVLPLMIFNADRRIAAGNTLSPSRSEPVVHLKQSLRA
jgi:hypothetical protein